MRYAQEKLAREDPYGCENSVTPVPMRDLFYVDVDDGHGQTFSERVASSNGWEWEFFNSPGTDLSKPSVHFMLGSPTFHWLRNVTEDDFRDPPGRKMKDDDEERALGSRVKLKGLQGRKDWNGKIGRCGPWLKDRERYHVIVELAGGRIEQAAVRSVNLVYAEPLSDSQLGEKIQRSAHGGQIGPCITYGCWAIPDHWKKHNPMDPIVVDPSGVEKIIAFNDTYRGPLSGKALALLHYLNPRVTDSRKPFTLSRLPLNKAKNTESDEYKRALYLERFIENIRALDTRLVDEWHSELKALRKESAWPERVYLKVTLDGLAPVVERELIVSPFLTVAVRDSPSFFCLRCCN